MASVLTNPASASINFQPGKEGGHVTVFVRNAAYLTQLLTKASKIRNGNKLI
jgi:hypothetical protein